MCGGPARAFFRIDSEHYTQQSRHLYLHRLPNPRMSNWQEDASPRSTSLFQPQHGCIDKGQAQECFSIMLSHKRTCLTKTPTANARAGNTSRLEALEFRDEHIRQPRHPRSDNRHDGRGCQTHLHCRHIDADLDQRHGAAGARRRVQRR
jgi:hypothetical protein